MESGGKRHTKRHTAKRRRGQRTGDGKAIGKWQRQLLMEPLKRDATNPRATVLWRDRVLVSANAPLTNRSWSAAAHALCSLEERGFVEVEPSRDSDQRRRKIQGYRLTALGAATADELMAYGGVTADAARRREHAKLRPIRVFENTRRMFAAQLRAAESRLVDPDFEEALRAELGTRGPGGGDVVLEAAHRYLELCAAAIGTITYGAAARAELDAAKTWSKLIEDEAS